MFDRFNAWVGSLIVQSQDLNLKKEDGQTMVEYVLVLSAVVVAILLLATWGGLQNAINNGITAVTDAM
jgi:Flp pilus assembly pilin Flp